VVDYSLHHCKVKGSSPVAASATGKEEMVKKVKVPGLTLKH
jgi:hypothetical protein